MTDTDDRIEQIMDYCQLMMSTASTREGRAAVWAITQFVHRIRSEDQIKKMEKNKGLYVVE